MQLYACNYIYIKHAIRIGKSNIDALRFVWREKPEDELLDYGMLLIFPGRSIDRV